MPVLSVEQLQKMAPAFRGRLGQSVANTLMRWLSVDKINQAYDHNAHLQGADFADGIMKDLGVKYQIGNVERLTQLPKDKAFITMSNHPYGSIDGLMMVDLFGHLRSDYKIIANQVLMMIEAMSSSFISVIPTLQEKQAICKENILGLKKILTHLSEDHAMGIFPAGAVSDYHIRGNCIQDRMWQESSLRLIQKAKVPILPVRFFDHNSRFFYFLGLIDWRIRSLRLPTEACNKRGKIQRMGIGQIISVEEQESFSNITALGKYIREKVYEMPLPNVFTPREDLFCV